ncbi:Methionyl-tRNA formyltransferase, mitochondrial [Holothuria leucospilota]|uniref:Methionyl-tRNA formyltransferase, mitochondrial n=1 Tax=Holothuria leucospilota TaxID=206669 RepID=A0A9Q1H889_HOLLE|nr:Methionyl-tRNA formyltransferase, mitochondrial [Holothuria leucospilota]
MIIVLKNVTPLIFRRRTVFHNFVRQCTSDHSQQGFRIVFFGSDSFAVKHLTALGLNAKGKCGNVVKHLEVVSSSPKVIQRRGKKRLETSPVVDYCQTEGLPLHLWPMDSIDGFDVGVVVSFGYMIPDRLIKCFSMGVLNVHPSLLPRWRGAAPIPHTILAGDKTTGVTIIRIKPDRFDVGPIVAQEEVSVPDAVTREALTELLAIKGSNMLLQVLGNLKSSLRKERKQSEEGVTYAPKLKASIGIINWNTTAQDVDRVFRAIDGKFPLRATWKGEEFRLFDMVPLIENLNHPVIQDVSDIPGSMVYHKQSETLQVRCQDGWVGFRGVGFGRRKNMTSKEFFNGFLSSSRSGNQTVLEAGRDER